MKKKMTKKQISKKNHKYYLKNREIILDKRKEYWIKKQRPRKISGKKEIVNHIEELERLVINMDMKQDDRFTLVGGLAVVKNLVNRS